MVAPVSRRLTGGWPPSDPHADLPIRMPAPPPRAPARIPRVLQGASLLRHPARPWPPIFVRRGFPASFRAPPCQALRPPMTRVSSAATTTRPTLKITRGPSNPHARPTTPPTLGRLTSCAGLPSPSQRGGAGGEDPSVPSVVRSSLRPLRVLRILIVSLPPSPPTRSTTAPPPNIAARIKAWHVLCSQSREHVRAGAVRRAPPQSTRRRGAIRDEPFRLLQ
jgi:hypothetical protein